MLKSFMGDPWEFWEQEVSTDRGNVFVLRLGQRSSGFAHTWVIDRERSPREGEIVLAKQSAPVPYETMEFSSFDDKGLGGMAKTIRKGTAKLSIDSDGISAKIGSKRIAMKKMNDGWIVKYLPKATD